MFAQYDTVGVDGNSLTKGNMPTINVRTDAKLKKDASEILRKLGLDMSGAIKLFLRQVIVTESIPFEIRTVNGFTVKEERELEEDIADMEKKIKAGKVKMYDSVREMHDDILKDL